LVCIKKEGFNTKIDLHCHTKKTKSGDPESRNVSKDVFLEKLNGASVSFVAITNHNHFDLDQYNSFSSNDKGITVFPGIEIDVRGKESNGHCLLITAPQNASEMEKIVKGMVGETPPDSFVIELPDLVNVIRAKDFIIIPHYGSKPHALNESDIQLLKNSIGNVPVLLEPSNLRSAGIMIAHNKSTIIGSDVRDWTKYSEAKLPELKIPFSGYEQFVKLLKKDIPTIETFVQGKFGEEVHIHPVQFPDCDVKIRIYNDINVIFGGKGTGKTELILAEVKKHFEDKGFSDVSTYFPNDNDNIQEFNSLKTNEPQESDLSKLTDDNLENDFQTINGHVTIPVTATSEYFKWVNSEKTKGLIFGFASSTFTESLQVLQNAFSLENTHYTNTKKAIDDLKKVAISPYLSDEDFQLLDRILTELRNQSWEKVIESFSKYNSAYLTNWSIEKLKTFYQNKKGVKVKPTHAGLISVFENSLKLFRATSSVQTAMNMDSFIEKKPIGYLADKGTIYREIEYSLNPISYRAKETKHLCPSINKENIKAYKKSIDDLATKSFSINEQQAIVEFKANYGQWNIKKLSDLLLCNTRIVDDSNSPYEPSPGEKAMLLLNFKLMDDSKNVYILDEPEAKVGHKYINNVIIPRLLELSRRDKKIIITTHDANIAVRTLPLLSIFREQYREGLKPKYRTYIGSPFLDKMKCYEDNTKEVDWVKMSMETLEGGEDAFIERGENYGR
jgi:hypothetical protein